MEEKDGKAKENPFLKVENVLKKEESEKSAVEEEKVEETSAEETKENTEETKE